MSEKQVPNPIAISRCILGSRPTSESLTYQEAMGFEDGGAWVTAADLLTAFDEGSLWATRTSGPTSRRCLCAPTGRQRLASRPHSHSSQTVRSQPTKTDSCPPSRLTGLVGGSWSPPQRLRTVRGSGEASSPLAELDKHSFFLAPNAPNSPSRARSRRPARSTCQARPPEVRGEAALAPYCWARSWRSFARACGKGAFSRARSSWRMASSMLP